MMKVQQMARIAGTNISMARFTILPVLPAWGPHEKLHLGSSGWTTSEAGVVASTL
jgi:hypothetical protein